MRFCEVKEKSFRALKLGSRDRVYFSLGIVTENPIWDWVPAFPRLFGMQIYVTFRKGKPLTSLVKGFQYWEKTSRRLVKQKTETNVVSILHTQGLEGWSRRKQFQIKNVKIDPKFYNIHI